MGKLGYVRRRCSHAARTIGYVALGAAVLALAAPARANFVTFESGQVRPLALAPDGSKLFAVNTPDDRLEIFAVDGSGGLTHTGSVPVGLEPVAVAVRADGSQAWVVNTLSDSVSVIDLTAATPHVIRTLLVGDEPRDIVFAVADRAFITTAHRGQNSPLQPTIDTVLRTPGTGRADVWVFDANDLGPSLGGTPMTILTLFTDTPRALAVSPDGNTVYAAGFHTGNQTTTVSEGVVCDDNTVDGLVQGPCTIMGTMYPGGLPLPETNVGGIKRPETGLIVKFDSGSGQWRDRLNRNWNNAVKFNLPDRDVFAINASANPAPVALSGPGNVFTGVGTVLFNMVVNPVSGVVYVSNTDAHNEVRFEGPGMFGGSTVRGHLHEARITVLDGTSTLPRHLNKHIDYGMVPSPAGVAEDSLAIPVGMAVTNDGSTLYVAAFGSSAVGVYDTSQLELDTFSPSLVPHIAVSGGGPSGLVLNQAKNRLYVATRFDNSISVINTSSNSEIAHLPVYNPEPAEVVNGRRFLYDAVLTSSNGEASCASCHIFGDFDSLAWDLGNPDDPVLPNLNPFRVTDPIGLAFPDHHPMKGPMTTQSLRGMANDGPMHWRGDRSGANDTPPLNALDEQAAFKRFNVAFAGLLGRSGPLTDAEMQAFTDFILQVTYPPNPIRALDNSLTPDEKAGHDFFTNNTASDVFQPCHGCHALDPANGHFGTDGFSSFENETQLFKIPHLRNLYQKIGMFGMPAISFLNAFDNGPKGDQVRGFGFLHDGSVDTIFRFHNAAVFDQCVPVFGCINPGGFANGAAGDTLRRQVESFMFAFDSNLAPIVGQQITLTDSNSGIVGPRIDLMIARAALGECDLTVKGMKSNQARGWLRTAAGTFQSDRASEAPITDAQLRAVAGTAGQELTYTCVPPGSGVRIGIDRDEDGFFDRTELDAGSNPADPNSIPGSNDCSAAPRSGCLTAGKSLLQLRTDAGKQRLNWKWVQGAQTNLSDLGNPVTGTTTYTLCIYSGTADALIAEVDVPAQGTCGGSECWKATGSGMKYKDKTLSNSGTELITLKAGAAGKARALVKGAGDNLPLPVFPSQGIDLPVTVQLNNSNNHCWEAQYGSATKSDASQFKAKF
jgi:YVTN family beta-propeller protein